MDNDVKDPANGLCHITDRLDPETLAWVARQMRKTAEDPATTKEAQSVLLAQADAVEVSTTTKDVIVVTKEADAKPVEEVIEDDAVAVDVRAEGTAKP